jgi:hypothetical protein
MLPLGRGDLVQRYRPFVGRAAVHGGVLPAPGGRRTPGRRRSRAPSRRFDAVPFDLDGVLLDRLADLDPDASPD